MCGFVQSLLRGVGLAAPAPPRVDPVAEREAAEADAQRKANTAIAFQKKALRDNSLFTGGGTTGSSQSTLGVG